MYVDPKLTTKNKYLKSGTGITPNMPIAAILEMWPDHKVQLENVLMKAGMGCSTCSSSADESLHDGAKKHSMQDPVFDQFMLDLNSAIKGKTDQQTKASPKDSFDSSCSTS